MGHIRAKIRRKRTKRRARRTAERIKRLKNKKREAWSRRARENMMLPHAKYSAQSQFYGLCSVMDDAAFRSSKTTLFIQSRKQGENVSVLTQRDIATNNLISAAAPHKRRIDEQARGCRDGMGGGRRGEGTKQIHISSGKTLAPTVVTKLQRPLSMDTSHSKSQRQPAAPPEKCVSCHRC